MKLPLRGVFRLSSFGCKDQRSLFKVAQILERIRETCEGLYFKDIKEVCRNPRKAEHQGPGGQDLKAAGRPQQQELRALAGLIIRRLY